MNRIKKFETFTDPSAEDYVYYYTTDDIQEAIECCEKGHLINYSNPPFTEEVEVIEYSLGDSFNMMSDEQINKYVKDSVPWDDLKKGVDLLSDLENAQGYADIIIVVNITGNFANFGDVYYFAERPEECIVKSVYYKGNNYKKEYFPAVVAGHELNLL